MDRLPKLLSFRAFIIAAASLQTLIWLALIVAVLFSDGAPGNASIDREIAILATIAFVATGVPALALASMNRWLGIAAVLALAPFAVFVGAVAAIFWIVHA